MERVTLPTTIAPVIQADRVKRAKPREDSGKESEFAKQLRQKRENPSDSQQAPEEEPEAAPAPAVEEKEEASGARMSPDDGRVQEPSGKLIDVHV
jgi:hypothetical protein